MNIPLKNIDDCCRIAENRFINFAGSEGEIAKAVDQVTDNAEEADKLDQKDDFDESKVDQKAREVDHKFQQTEQLLQTLSDRSALEKKLSELKSAFLKKVQSYEQTISQIDATTQEKLKEVEANLLQDLQELEGELNSVVKPERQEQPSLLKIPDDLDASTREKIEASESIVDVLKDLGMSSDKDTRAKLYAEMTGGTPEDYPRTDNFDENVQLLNWVKGKVKVTDEVEQVSSQDTATGEVTDNVQTKIEDQGRSDQQPDSRSQNEKPAGDLAGSKPASQPDPAPPTVSPARTEIADPKQVNQEVRTGRKADTSQGSQSADDHPESTNEQQSDPHVDQAGHPAETAQEAQERQKKQKLLKEISQTVIQDPEAVRALGEVFDKHRDFAEDVFNTVLTAGGEEFQKKVFENMKAKATFGDKIDIATEIGLKDSYKVLTSNPKKASAILLQEAAQNPKLLGVLLDVAIKRGVANEVLQSLPSEVTDKLVRRAAEKPELMNKIMPIIERVLSENPKLVETIFKAIPDDKKINIAERMIDKHPDLVGKIMEKAMSDETVMNKLWENEKFRGLLVDICQKNEAIQRKLAVAIPARGGELLGGETGKQIGKMLGGLFEGFSGFAEALGQGKEVDEIKKALSQDPEIQRIAFAEVRENLREYVGVLSDQDKAQMINFGLREPSLAEARNQIIGEMMQDKETRKIIIKEAGSDVLRYLLS